MLMAVMRMDVMNAMAAKVRRLHAIVICEDYDGVTIY
jgi:hypothetical protein